SHFTAISVPYVEQNGHEPPGSKLGIVLLVLRAKGPTDHQRVMPVLVAHSPLEPLSRPRCERAIALGAELGKRALIGSPPPERRLAFSIAEQDVRTTFFLETRR